jgi:hypothetical protein
MRNSGVGVRIGALAIALAILLAPLCGGSVAEAKGLKLKKKPAHLSFGKQVINTASPSKVISIKNSGSAPITIQSVTVTGSFIEAGSCVGVLAPGGACTISVAFRPMATRKRKGSIAITDDAKGSPQKISLSGVGTNPVPVAAPIATLPPVSGTGNFVAVSPLGESTLGANPTTATFQAAPNVPQIVAVMDTSRSFGWTAVSPAWFQIKGAEVGPLSTAVQLVYMVPGVFSADLSGQQAIVSALSKLIEVQSFANALQSNASAPDPLSTPAVQSAYSSAVTAALGAIAALPARSPRAAAIDLKLAPATSPASASTIGRSLMPLATISFNGPSSPW